MPLRGYGRDAKNASVSENPMSHTTGLRVEIMHVVLRRAEREREASWRLGDEMRGVEIVVRMLRVLGELQMGMGLRCGFEEAERYVARVVRGAAVKGGAVSGLRAA